MDSFAPPCPGLGSRVTNFLKIKYLPLTLSFGFSSAVVASDESWQSVVAPTNNNNLTMESNYGR